MTRARGHPGSTVSPGLATAPAELAVVFEGSTAEIFVFRSEIIRSVVGRFTGEAGTGPPRVFATMPGFCESFAVGVSIGGRITGRTAVDGARDPVRSGVGAETESFGGGRKLMTGWY